MRIIIFLAVLGFGAWWGVKNMGKPREGGGFMAGAVAGLGGKMVSGEDGPPAPPMPADPAPLPSIVPNSSGSPMGPASSSFRPAVGIEQTRFPGVEMVSRVHRFRFRNPPVASEVLASARGDLAVTVDLPTRSVFLYGPIDAVDPVHRFLQTIDQLPRTCSVQTWAVYVDRTAQNGFDLVAAIKAVTGASLLADVGNGGLTLSASSGDISAALSVIADGSVVEVIQRPHVLLEHGSPAIIESIQEVPVPSTSVSQGIAQTSIEYRKVGLQLEVTPEFYDGGNIRLQIKQSNGLIGQTLQISGNSVPVIQSQTVGTAANLKLGQTVVLGGVTTLRRKVAKGLLRNVEEVSEGSLYIILSTYSDVPLALPVETPDPQNPFASASPIGLPDPDEWLDSQLLPPRGWEDDERELIEAIESDHK